MHKHTARLRIAHFQGIEERFAFLQEAINYGIYQERKPNQNDHRELDQLGDDHWREMNMDRVKMKAGELAAARFEIDPGYRDWLREQDMTDPRDL